MKNSESYKPPMPKNGKKVNDWETLRPYVEKAAPPMQENIADTPFENKVQVSPQWGFGYSAEIPEEEIPKEEK